MTKAICPPAFFDRVYRLDGRSTGGDDVVNYHHRITGREIAFDPLLPGHVFRCFSDRENLEWAGRILACAAIRCSAQPDRHPSLDRR